MLRGEEGFDGGGGGGGGAGAGAAGGAAGGAHTETLILLYQLVLRMPIVAMSFGCLCGVVMLALDQLGIEYAYHAKKAGHKFADKHRSVATQLVMGSGAMLGLLLLFLRLGEATRVTPNVTVGAYTIIMGLGLLLPMHSVMRDGVNFLLSTIGRVFLPSTDVPFVEVLVADALCSLGRVFSDLGLALLVLAHSWTAEAPPTQLSRVVVASALACLPSALRVRQCAILLAAEPDPARRRLHALNIGKYLSTMPPVVLGGLHALAHPALEGVPLATAAACAAAFNTAYCLAWDVRMDWGLGEVRGKGGAPLGLRATLLLGAAWPYYAAIAADAALRCAWVIPLLESGTGALRGGHATASAVALAQRPLAALGTALARTDLTLVLELVEVCRRCMWAVLRLEWESVQTHHHGHGTAAEEEAELEKLAGA